MTNFKGRRPTNPFDGQEESIFDMLFKENSQIGRDSDGDLGMSEELAREIAKSILMGSTVDLFEKEPMRIDSDEPRIDGSIKDFLTTTDSVESSLDKGIKEAVKHPDHYNKGILETMEKFILFFHDNPDMIKGALLFNVLKYTDRAEHKGKKEEDEKKAMFYLDVFETLFEEEAQLYNLYRIFKGK